MSDPIEMKSELRWYHRIGPGLITACVVIGPGSIMTSSNVGAGYGYGLSWVVVAAVFFMLVYMTLGARLGVAAGRSAGTLLSDRVGRWFAITVGAGVFFISAAYQFGNNLGVHFALANYIDFKFLVVIFNGFAIAFLLVFKNMYRALEKLMMVFVGLMLISFACNLIFAGPNLQVWAKGFVPRPADMLDLSVLGLVGTTFVATAAFYQSYLVRQKGWSKGDLKQGMVDVRVGAILMALITLMLMATPATVFHQDFQLQEVVADSGDSDFKPNTTLVIDDADAAEFKRLKEQAEAEAHMRTDKPRWTAVLGKSEFSAQTGDLEKPPVLKQRGFSSLVDVGASLKPLFGAIGPHLFFLGVFAAAYSSFLVNSMIGGFMMADGLGLGDRPDTMWPKVFTIAVLLTGMSVGLYCIYILEGQSPVTLIVAAQAVTVIASPLVAGSLWWLTNREDVMGKLRNGPVMNILAGIGFALLLAMAAYLAIVKIPAGIEKLQQTKVEAKAE